jgi:hypothetical protein
VIKALFREAAKAFTPKGPAQEPTPRRRQREEETQGGFRLFARKITRQVVRSFLHPSNFPFVTPPDPDNSQRLYLLHFSNAHHAASSDAASDHFRTSASNHLSPRL